MIIKNKFFGQLMSIDTPHHTNKKKFMQIELLDSKIIILI
jgi:hypothetical protein